MRIDSEAPAGPFSSSAGLSPVSRGRLRGPGYVPLLRGAHQAVDLEVTHGARIQAFRQVEADDLVLLSHSAAWALGATFAGPGEPVAVGMPTRHRIRTREHVSGHLARLDPTETITTAVGLATTPARTVVDIARGVGAHRVPLAQRVARVDAVLRATALPVADARLAAAELRRLRGLPLARAVLDRCADGADSMRETYVRLAVVDAGFPVPVTQCPVFLDGRRVAALDLGWPALKIGLEYDGGYHDDPEQVAADRCRHNLIKLAGWRALQVDRHLFRRRREMLRQLGALFASARGA